MALNKVHYVPSANLRGIAHTFCGLEGYKARGTDSEYEDAAGRRFEARTRPQSWDGVTCKKCLTRKPKE